MVCRPAIKFGQIRTRIESILKTIRLVVAPFYIDSDIDKRLRQREAVSDQILGELSQIWGRHQFGSSLRAMQITQNGIAEHLHRDYGKRLRRQKGTETEAAVSRPAAAPPLPRPALMAGAPPLPGRPSRQEHAAVAAARTAPGPSVSQAVLSREAYLARSAMEYWIDTLAALARGEGLNQISGLSGELATEMVSELTAAARRSGLEARIALEIARLGGGSVERHDTLLEKAGFYATSLINRFVNTLGFDVRPEAERPKAPQGDGQADVPVFARRAVVSNCDALPAERQHFAYTALSEWMYSFHQVVVDNALSGEGVTINIDANNRLKAILDGLDASLGRADTVASGLTT